MAIDDSVCLILNDPGVFSMAIDDSNILRATMVLPSGQTVDSHGKIHDAMKMGKQNREKIHELSTGPCSNSQSVSLPQLIYHYEPIIVILLMYS